MRKLSYVFYLVLLCVILSCTIGLTNAEFKQKGIYECKSRVKLDAPVFRFNSESDSTIVHLGSNSHLEFYDLNSKQIVNLYEDSYNYECKCIVTNAY